MAELDLRRIEEAMTETRIVQAQPDGPQPWKLQADVCIVGAGIAGVSAAIESARLGLDVVLVDGLPTLGGQAVNGIIVTFVGLYSNGPDPSRHQQLTRGIVDEILEELGEQDALHYRRNDWTTVLYDEVALGRWVERTVLAEGIRPVLGATMRNVEFSDR